MTRSLLVSSATLALFAATAQAQRPPRDSLRVPVLDASVAIADRAPTPLRASAASVVLLTAADLRRMPHTTVADVLRAVPGFSLVSFDGLGFDPAVMTRGFYGGGEAEYVVVLVDGKRVSQLQTGLVTWDALPAVSTIESIEVVRGSSSSLYGDAAIGGVINIITKGRTLVPLGSAPPRVDQVEIGGGSYATFRAAADMPGSSSTFGVAIGTTVDRTGGFRRHAKRSTNRWRLSLPLVEERAALLSVSLQGHIRNLDEPGPLLASLADEDRRASDPLFRFDRTSDDGFQLQLDGVRWIPRGKLTAALVGEQRSIEGVRTLALAPGYGDTRERVTAARRVGGTAQMELFDSPVSARHRLILGVEANRGSLDSKYYQYTGGTRDMYETAEPDRGDMDNEADVVRTAGAAFAHYNLRLTTSLRFSGGGRWDRLVDRSDSPGSPRVTRSHSTFSPKGGLNWEYVNAARHAGNVFVSAGRSFKAPTLDQRYDQRPIPVPFDPFSITTSNADLEPQFGTSVEGGFYHRVALSDTLALVLSTSAYQIDMKNELDFDVAALRYVNIGTSRHRGLEAAAHLGGQRGNLFANYTRQDATAQSGTNTGLALKAIPRHTLAAGLGLTHQGGPSDPMQELSLIATQARRIFLDDANTVKLPDYTRLDLRWSFVDRQGHGLYLDVRNLLGRKYSTTGYLDPAGSGEAYLYPAAGRVFEVSIKR